ncbi:MAG TPA: glycosyltransferase family 9 protein, partial [Candidatus Cloacimonadota bacterium]|nr:glycosyltransferase family 9 protein [Candidatus Cloacimonadota bacterium]
MEYHKILIIRLSSLGDVVLTQSVAAVLSHKFPNVEIHFLTKRAFVDVVKAFGCLDAIHVWEENKSLSQLLKLKRLKFDLVIDLHNKLSTFWIKTVVGGRKTVTYNKQHLLRLRIVKHRTQKVISSTVRLYFSALQKAGIAAEVENPQLFPAAELPLQIAKQLTNDKINLAIFPGALHKTKQYPLDQLAQVINALGERYNIFLLGSLD